MATKQTTNRKLGMEFLEDRKLMTVMTEFAELSRPVQIGSEHWPEPAAEVAVEKVTNDRQGYFSRGLHNNGAFREPTGHILWNTTDNSGDSSKSYTDSGQIPNYAYELKNVQVTSVVATTNGQDQFKRDPIVRLRDGSADTGTLEAIAKSQKNDAAYIKFDGIMDSANTGTLEEIAKSQKNDAAYIKFDGIMASANTGTLEEIAKSQKNDAAYIKFDGIMGASKTPNPHVAIDQLFSLVGEGERSFMAKDLWG